jgi:hypothetical protein
MTALDTLAQLGEVARNCSNLEYREFARSAVHEVSEAVKVMHAFPDAESLRLLNGAWAKAARIYSNLPPEGAPAPLAGAPEAARLAA